MPNSLAALDGLTHASVPRPIRIAERATMLACLAVDRSRATSMQRTKDDRHAVDGHRHAAVVVARLVTGGRQLQAVLAQQAMHDCLDLELAEHHADALVRTAAERGERITVLLVLVARLREPRRIEALRFGPQLLEAMVDRRPGHHVGARRDEVPQQVGVADGLAEVEW